jgi:hypothetical protein
MNFARDRILQQYELTAAAHLGSRMEAELIYSILSATNYAANCTDRHYLRKSGCTIFAMLARKLHLYKSRRYMGQES